MPLPKRTALVALILAMYTGAASAQEAPAGPIVVFERDDAAEPGGSARIIRSYPRIGDEVIVDFLEGDSDHMPIIIGRVYDSEDSPGYSPPPETDDGHEEHGYPQAPRPDAYFIAYPEDTYDDEIRLVVVEGHR